MSRGLVYKKTDMFIVSVPHSMFDDVSSLPDKACAAVGCPDSRERRNFRFSRGKSNVESRVVDFVDFVGRLDVDLSAHREERADSA